MSFGTSVNATREKTIDRIEADIQKAMPDRAFYRAWTSGMIIRKIEKRDDVHINTVEEAMEQMLLDGITDVIVQPTHGIRGIEYDQLKEAVLERRSQFEQVRIGNSLLTTSEDTYEVLPGSDGRLELSKKRKQLYLWDMEPLMIVTVFIQNWISG